MSDRLLRLHSEHGQSPWLDNLKRSLLDDGSLATLRDGGVRGLTSNPTIFQKAIQGSQDYDEQFRELVAAGSSVIDCYWQLVLADIRRAADVFGSVYTSSGGGDGFVSVEVDPNLAHDTDATLDAARHLWRQADRANLMIKVPATVEGLPVIRTLIAEGHNVNVTLIFGLDRYQKVMDAYIAGLEDLVAAGGDPSRVASVASFFISRVDSDVDAQLESIATDSALALRGRAAIAQARIAYESFRRTFSGGRWEALVAAGARVQRPLWASTSTKNPSYPDTLYVDELIGPDSVNTLPDQTLDAFADHGRLARRLDIADSHEVWSSIHSEGIDMNAVADKLEREGVASFKKSFDDLLSALDAKRAELRS